MELIKVENISKSFGGKYALDNVSFNIQKGKIFGLLGPNGAGKTTLLRILNRITLPDKGEVFFNGEPICDEHISTVGYLPEERGLYKKMKVGEQALFFARLKGMSKSDAKNELLKWFMRFGIQSWWDKKVEELSKGMAQKVQFIVTVVHRPQLLILDEPFSGFDPVNAELIKNEILKLRDEGTTVILSSHNMNSVQELCDDILLLNKSREVLKGGVKEIRERFGRNRYSVVFRGKPDDFNEAIAENVGDVTVTEESENVYRAVFLIKEHTEKKSVISLLNERVDILEFSSALPSMNEIFINQIERVEHEQ